MKKILIVFGTRPEALEAGTVKLVGTDIDLIRNEAQKLIDDHAVYRRMSQASNPYGDGTACKQVVECMREI